MKLVGETAKLINDALLDAFKDKAALERLVSYELDEDLELIADGKLVDVVHNLVRWAAAREKVDELLKAAMSANPKNAKLRSCFNHWQRASDSATPKEVSEADLKNTKANQLQTAAPTPTSHTINEEFPTPDAPTANAPHTNQPETAISHETGEATRHAPAATPRQEANLVANRRALVASLVLLAFAVGLIIIHRNRNPNVNIPKIRNVEASVEDIGAWLIGLKIDSTVDGAIIAEEDVFWLELSADESFDGSQVTPWNRDGNSDSENVSLHGVFRDKLHSGMELYGEFFYLRLGVGANQHTVRWSEPTQVQIEMRK